MDIEKLVADKAAAAKKASRRLGTASTAVKNRALLAMAEALENNVELVLAENAADLAEAKKGNLKPAFMDRLLLDEGRVRQMAEGLRQIAALPDPIGEGVFSTVRPNGLEISCVRVPLGVVAIVYEARPNVTADALAICLKSGNAVLLRGGSEAIRSNRAIFQVLSEAAYASGIPAGALQLVEVTDRAAVKALLHLNGLIDVVIPRGGAGLIKTVVNSSTVPVIETGTGICHTFVDASADLDQALAIAINAKTTRPSVCNAMETLLVHEKAAAEFLPRLCEVMTAKKVELRGCEKCLKVVPSMKKATDEDWATEYLDYILSVKIVSDIDEAIEHINRYNTGHSEAIVTRDLENAHRFRQEVDAAAVYVNASTRFTDGFEFGFGAEIGISTQKLHVRGPMGLEALTSMKYLIYGEGQIR